MNSKPVGLLGLLLIVISFGIMLNTTKDEGQVMPLVFVFCAGQVLCAWGWSDMKISFRRTPRA